MDYANVALEVGLKGFAYRADFLSQRLLTDLQMDFRNIQKSQGFDRAGTGKGSGYEVRDPVRLDEVHWIDNHSPTPAQVGLWQELESLKTAFNRNLYLGLKEFNGHYAAYPSGGFYQRHLDSFQNDNSRKISVVLYLNQDWQTTDGGELRIYGAQFHIDVQPRGGTMVCFLSGECEHEVLRTHGERISFTGWFS